MQGAALVSEHIFPLSVIAPVQQFNPFLSLHPEPPQYPQPAWDDTCPYGKAKSAWCGTCKTFRTGSMQAKPRAHTSK